MIEFPWVGAAVGCVATFLLIGLFKPLAIRSGLVDEPAGRKLHRGPVPLTGGLAMACGFALAVLTVDTGLPQFRAMFAGAGILVITGVLDDYHELSSRARFAAQIGAALIMVYWGGVQLIDFGALRADGALAELGVWVVPLTVFSCVGVINALNMIDGLDGLAGSMTLVALSGLAFISASAGRGAEFALNAVLISVVVAFLLHNLPLSRARRASAFMGDAGSMFLGFVLTWLVIDLSQGADRAMAPVTALWLLMVPLFDTVRLLIFRPLTGSSPFRADFDHLHHWLRKAGLSSGSSLILMTAWAVLAGGLGVFSKQIGIGEQAMFYAFLGLFAGYCALLAWIRWRGRLGWITFDRRIAVTRRGAGERRIAERRTAEDRRDTPDRRDNPDGGD